MFKITQSMQLFKMTLLMIGCSFFVSMQAVVDENSFQSWNNLCECGNYQELLNEHYEIMNYKGEQDNLQANIWREERLKKLEIPVAWIHMSFYLKDQIDEVKSAQKERWKKMVILGMQIYMRIKMDTATYFRVTVLEFPLAEAWFSKLKKCLNKYSLTQTDYSEFLSEAVEAVRDYLIIDRDAAHQNNAAQRDSTVLKFPEMAILTHLKTKTWLSYLNYGNWYTPSIEIQGTFEDVAHHFPSNLSELNRLRWIGIDRSINELKEIKNLLPE